MQSQFNPLLLAVYLIALLSCAWTNASAGEVRTFRKEIRQVMGSAISQDDARIAAIARAKREALEEAGTYLESFSVVHNAILEQDEILALSSGVLKAVIVEEQPFLEAGVFGILVVAEVRVDPSVLDARIAKLLADRKHLAQLRVAVQRQQELLEKIKQLEAEGVRLNRSGTATSAQKLALNVQFKDITTRLTARDWYARGHALWNGIKYVQAEKVVEFFSRAIALDPDFAGAFNGRGNAYADLRQYVNAIKDYNEALRLDANFAIAYNNRGITFNDQKKYKRAIEDFDQALRLNPKYAAAYSNRAEGYLRLNLYEQAFADLEQALQIDPNYSPALVVRGYAYHLIKQKEKALEDLERALQLDPNMAGAYNVRGTVYIGLKQYERGIFDFNKALILEADNHLAFMGRGISYMYLKQYQKMISDLTQVLRLDPRNWAAFGLRGAGHLLVGEFQQSISDNTEALRLNPARAALYSGRAFAHFYLGNLTAACDDWRKVEELEGGQGNVRD